MGRAFVFGDDISTDLLAPGTLMKLPADELAKHCMAAVDPTFATRIRPGDVLVAGKSFGQGSSREQAAVSLKLLGISAVFARSFARIFYRNAINIGLPAFTLPLNVTIGEGDEIKLNSVSGQCVNVTKGNTFAVSPLPPHLLELIEVGGLIPLLEKRFSGTGRSGFGPK